MTSSTRPAIKASADTPPADCGSVAAALGVGREVVTIAALFSVAVADGCRVAVMACATVVGSRVAVAGLGVDDAGIVVAVNVNVRV